MIPVIFILGKTACGKGTLGPRLAKEFNLYHISIGDTYYSMMQQFGKPIEGMPNNINRCLAQGLVIPDRALEIFEPGTVPVALLMHNSLVRKEKHYQLHKEILQEKFAELTAKGDALPAAFLVDGLHYVFSAHPVENWSRVLHEFAPTFSGLTILIETPKDVARLRWIERAHVRGRVDEEEFGKRSNWDDTILPPLVEFLERQGVLVRIMNDGGMTMDDAYRALLQNLFPVHTWHFLVEAPSGKDNRSRLNYV